MKMNSVQVSNLYLLFNSMMMCNIKLSKEQVNNKIEIENGYFGNDYENISLSWNISLNVVRKKFIIFLGELIYFMIKHDLSLTYKQSLEV
jgi:hypothetical protein